MALRKKTGGRKKGTPNKATQDIAALLESMKCDPIEKLARICNGEKIRCGITTLVGHQIVEAVPTLEQQYKAAAELAQYVAPKRKAVEVSNPDGTPISFTLALGENARGN